MMRWLLVALALAGCPQGGGARSPTEPKPPVKTEPPVERRALTAAELEGWLAYQRVMLALPPIAKADGGGPGQAVVARARTDAAARADAGLTEEDVDRIEEVVGAVVTQRSIARITGAEALKEFERATAELTDAKREQAEKALADLRARAQQSSSLAEERTRYGEASVEAVLAREAEVTRTWEALAEARGGKR